ncbi:hypothetical protein PAXRUDRAFT_789696, partial [Paxillus rubicundulus Ve08.2h10]
YSPILYSSNPTSLCIVVAPRFLVNLTQLWLGPSRFSFLLLCKNPFPLPQVQLFVVSHS